MEKQFQKFIIFMYSQPNIYLNGTFFPGQFDQISYYQGAPQHFFYLYPSHPHLQQSFMAVTHFSKPNSGPQNSQKDDSHQSINEIEDGMSENIEVPVRKIFLTKKQLGAVPETKPKITWTEKEDEELCSLIQEQNLGWKQVAARMNRTYKMCYSRYRRIRLGTKNSWRKDEEERAKELVQKYGMKWKQISQYLPGRAPKQIRERYINFIRPSIKLDNWTPEEDLKLIELVNTHGKKWKKISEILEKRTQNQIKNRFFSRIMKIWNKKQKNSL